MASPCYCCVGSSCSSKSFRLRRPHTGAKLSAVLHSCSSATLACWFYGFVRCVIRLATLFAVSKKHCSPWCGVYITAEQSWRSFEPAVHLNQIIMELSGCLNVCLCAFNLCVSARTIGHSRKDRS